MIVVAVFDETGQLMPSIVTVSAEPKFVPVIVTVVPPIDDPNAGDTFVIVEVLVWA